MRASLASANMSSDAKKQVKFALAVALLREHVEDSNPDHSLQSRPSLAGNDAASLLPDDDGWIASSIAAHRTNLIQAFSPVRSVQPGCVALCHWCHGRLPQWYRANADSIRASIGDSDCPETTQVASSRPRVRPLPRSSDLLRATADSVACAGGTSEPEA